MFMKTIAVGPLDDVASWVTGGTTVAIDFICPRRHFGAVGLVFMAATLGMIEGEACL